MFVTAKGQVGKDFVKCGGGIVGIKTLLYPLIRPSGTFSPREKV
jgi:hypothetical protein